MKVTQKDIAKESGFSQQMVSLVINGGDDPDLPVKPETRKRILETAKQLGYMHNYHARALKTGRSLTFGLMLPQDMARSYFGQELTKGVHARTGELDYELLVFSQGSALKAANCLAEKRIDGLVMYFPGKAITRDLVNRWPLVLVQKPAENGFPSVIVDEAPGIRQAAVHLAELGHRKVLYLEPGPDSKGRIENRRNIFLNALKDAGLESAELTLAHPENKNWNIGQQLEWYRQEIKNKLSFSSEVTVIMCYSDSIALALYSVLQSRGIRIPEEMSVTGFDNFFANLAIPGLTTVSHMLPEIGSRAVDLLVELIDKKIEYPHEVEIKVPSELVVRNSTAPASGSGVQGSGLIGMNTI